MGCRLNDLAGISASLNTVPEAIWRSSAQAFQIDNAPALFREHGATSIFATLDRDGSSRVFN